MNDNALYGRWKDKKVLFIGDSLTARRVYPEVVKEILGIQTFYHCKGGASLRSMVDGDNGLGGDYDNETDAQGVLRPLSVEDVAEKDLIVFFGGYNNRNVDIGQIGDVYKPDGSGQTTIAGFMQYAINRIYETLYAAGNMTARLLIVTVDCVGRYPWVDADGYGESTPGTGRTMEALANMQKAVAARNGIACCDLFHTSGINSYTWAYFGKDSYPDNLNYTPYLLNAEGYPLSAERIRYERGRSYYQFRDGKVVLEKYTGTTPYPYCADHLHKSTAGYRRIGEVIAGSIIASYGI